MLASMTNTLPVKSANATGLIAFGHSVLTNLFKCFMPIGMVLCVRVCVVMRYF